jgi:hypothetical protein
MTVKVILLKSGEDVISDAKEILDNERQGIIAYHLSNPYIMQLTSRTEDGNDDQPRTKFSVQYTHWAPLSKQRQFAIPADWVVTIYDPHDSIMNDYCAKHNIKPEEESDAGSETAPA